MKKFLVIGNPIEHSLSPILHNYWIKSNDIDAIYEKQKLDEHELEQLISQIKQKKIDGVNVTVPFKKVIIPFLDKLTNEAKSTQSVNTLYLKDNKVIGHNTDIVGFETSIKKSKFDVSNKDILVLGAGGVVPSIIFALNKMKVSKIKISNRTKEKADNLKKLFNNIEIIEWGKVPNFDMIINATSIGLKKGDRINLDFSLTSKNSFFYDVIYNPRETN
ncbi:shikimate dehydrogenase, partial [Candidatus Pelagibacter sp.]|nr:shikimate dehydrogenase [Candidatus Pelagibacter sp.]